VTMSGSNNKVIASQRGDNKEIKVSVKGRDHIMYIRQ